ncbi:unnamed protein product [Mytilus edulis]|uniref:Uncharacterized protein n=1 Tax=Mytilus edulis TaxID=6550 RepID=A0A8S3V509_MYTED|nr:unnamed protein product [Mytilus edulis]
MICWLEVLSLTMYTKLDSMMIYRNVHVQIGGNITGHVSICWSVMMNMPNKDWNTLPEYYKATPHFNIDFGLLETNRTETLIVNNASSSMKYECQQDSTACRDNTVKIPLPKLKTSKTTVRGGCSYMSNKVSTVKRHKNVHIKDKPKSAVIIPDIDLSSDADKYFRKDAGQIIGPIITEETNSDENNNEDETNKIDPITEATKRVTCSTCFDSLAGLGLS